MKMLFFFDRYPLVKLNFFFFVSHICLVLLQNGRKEMDKLVETTADQIRREMKIYIKHKQIFVVSNIAETVPLLLSFYAPLTETWLCMMERGQGRQGREYSGILFGQQKLNPKIYIWASGGYGRPVGLPGHFPSDLSNYYSDEL